MHASTWESSNWHAALSLSERLPLDTRDAHVAAVDSGVAERRLARWRSQPPFEDSVLFASRLASDGIDTPTLLALLGESPESLATRVERPAYVNALANAFANDGSEPEPLAVGPLAIAEPVVAEARVRLASVIDNIRSCDGAVPFDRTSVVDLLIPILTTQLSGIISRTFVLELQVVRLLGQLEGETPEARYASFARRLRDARHATALLHEYPVLAREVQETADRWVDAGREFLEHLLQDEQLLRDVLNGGERLGELIALDGGRGDRHRGGRAVLIARFDSGLRVVYKPRSLAVEDHFQDLLGWINARGAEPQFPILTVLDRGSHGWVEHVSPKGCGTRAELDRFYQRQGGYLALLHALKATDLHYENLIAAGEYPVLLDLEALFHHQADGLDPAHADDVADAGLGQSVLSVGLLPQRSWERSDGAGVDVSGLGGAGGQLTPHAALAVDGDGSDAMRMTRKRLPIPAARNQPTLDGVAQHVLPHVEELVAGFERVYRLLLEHRDELLAEGGPVAAFAGDELRVILRPTQVYGRLLQESYHPDVLRNALDRDRLLDRLWGWVPSIPSLARVIASEQADLRRGDIPVFTTSPTNRDLYASDGQRIEGYFEHSGMDLVRERVNAMSEADLVHQVWIIRASLAASQASDLNPAFVPYQLTGAGLTPDRDRLISAACRVADRLDGLAVRAANEVAWVGLRVVSRGQYNLAPIGASLYDGQAGVALFLAHIGNVSGRDRYTTLARQAVATLLRQLNRNRALDTDIGAYTGWGGAIYALSHLGALWDEPDLHDEAASIVETIASMLPNDTVFDVLGGSAGCIASLLVFDAARPSSRTIEVAVACADHLLAYAEPAAGGIGWQSGGSSAPLTGFSHGTAGIAWALLGVAERTRIERFRSAARAAIAAERATFEPVTGNWPDLRDPEFGGYERAGGAPAFMTTWCHGAPGIGLARLRSAIADDDPVARDEIEVAVATTLRDGFGFGHSLCHGDLGNLELLLLARERLGSELAAQHVDRLAGAILGSIDRHGWICGVPSAVETPGLLTGIAGIGYQLLRLAEPNSIPSVLTLEPPLLAGSSGDVAPALAEGAAR